MHTHTNVHTHTCITHAHSQTHMHTNTLTHMHAYTLSHTHAYTYTFTQKCFISRHPSTLLLHLGRPVAALGPVPPLHVLPAPHLSGPHTADPRRHTSRLPSLCRQCPGSRCEGPTASPTGPTSSITQLSSLSLPHANQRVQGTSPASPGGQWEERGSDRQARSLYESSQGPRESTVGG